MITEKLKNKLPKTKEQNKYLGPETVQKVTDSHVIISQDKLGKKIKKDQFLFTLLVLTLSETNSSQKVKRIHSDSERQTLLHKKQSTVSDKTSNST